MDANQDWDTKQMHRTVCLIGKPKRPVESPVYFLISADERQLAVNPQRNFV